MRRFLILGKGELSKNPVMRYSWPFSQSWLPEEEMDFRPGRANFSWSQGHLSLEADLIDEEVSSIATAHQQRLWEQGDVIELFFQREGKDDYYEYQIAPNGFTLALHYPDLSQVMAVRRGERPLEEFFSRELIEAEAEMTPKGWKARLSVPLDAKEGDQMRVSCSRYDYGTGRAPILSSTSPHPIRDFHRPQDWRKMIL